MSASMYGIRPNSDTRSSREWATELAPFGERKLKVVWDISNKCNLRCRMCHFSFDHVFFQPAKHMLPETFSRIAEVLLPRAHTLILSAGNEPLMSPHFLEILMIASRYNVPNLLFLTNAQLLDEKIADAVIDNAVTQVQISIDGATKETYEDVRRGARFDRLVRNLQHLSARKAALGQKSPLLQFNIVLMQRNLEELPLFVDLAEHVGVEWIAARHLLIMKGLNMEGETLAHDARRANMFFRRFLQRVERSTTVTLISFPDFFNDAQITAASAAPQSKPVAVTDELPIPTSFTGQQQDVSSPMGGERIEQQNQPPVMKKKRSIAQRTVRELCRIPRNLRRAFVSTRAPVRGSVPKATLAAPPFGSVDIPTEIETEVNNAVQIEGWALDRIEVTRVTIEREPFIDDPKKLLNKRGLVGIGEARVLIGSRPDVSRAFPLYPHGYRAGWSFELRREMISTAEKFRTVVHAVAHNVDGRYMRIGSRSLSFGESGTAKPYLFCSRPFDSIFIDSKGDVRPYPDCRVERPFGSVADKASRLTDVWFGKDFVELRRRIIERDPPPMCLTCAHFINRNVDDRSYFQSR